MTWLVHKDLFKGRMLFYSTVGTVTKYDMSIHDQRNHRLSQMDDLYNNASVLVQTETI